MNEQVEEIKEIKTAPTTQPQVKDEEKAKENVEAAQSEIFDSRWKLIRNLLDNELRLINTYAYF